MQVGVQAQKHGLEPCDVRFTRRDVREVTQLGDTQLKVHLSRLVEMEYLHLMRDRHSQRFVYALGAGVEGISESICGYEEKPVGGGRGRSECGVRPVFGSNDKDLDKPVGALGKPRSTGTANGASYHKHHISSLVAHQAQAVGEA